MRRFVSLLALGFATDAQAHSFAAGLETYDFFLEGVSLPFHTPEMALAVLSLGLLIGLWDPQGMPKVWPALAVGVLVGLALPAVVRFDPVLLLYAVALGASLLGAARLSLSKGLMRIWSGIAGGAIAYGAITSHGLEGLPAIVPIGIFMGINFFVAATAGLASLPQRGIAGPLPVIGLRIAASWLAAVTMMMMAFAVR